MLGTRNLAGSMTKLWQSLKQELLRKEVDISLGRLERVYDDEPSLFSRRFSSVYM